MKHVVKKIAATVIVLAMVVCLVPTWSHETYAAAVSTTIRVGFQNDSDASEGEVRYSLDGTTWTTLSSGDTVVNHEDTQQIRIRIVPNQDKQIDWTATSYTEKEVDSNGTVIVEAQLSDSNYAPYCGGLGGGNGYYVSNNARFVELAGVEFADNNGGQSGGNYTATINLSACNDLNDNSSWTGVPSCGHETCTIEYAKTWCCVQVGINGGQRTQSKRFEPEMGCYEDGSTTIPTELAQQQVL